MNLHRQSLVVEKRHLDQALERLKIDCVTYDLTATDLDLLRRQRIAMKEYSYMLGLRIEQLPPISVDD